MLKKHAGEIYRIPDPYFRARWPPYWAWREGIRERWFLDQLSDRPAPRLDKWGSELWSARHFADEKAKWRSPTGAILIVLLLLESKTSFQRTTRFAGASSASAVRRIRDHLLLSWPMVSLPRTTLPTDTRASAGGVLSGHPRLLREQEMDPESADAYHHPREWKLGRQMLSSCL